MGANYYKILGIDKSASDDEIKKAYKKMALRWHPDRNQGSEEANQKFKQISEAFEVLSDPQKRTVYDQFGEEGLKSGGGPPPGAGGGFPGGGVPGGGGFSSGGFPGGTTFTFTSGPGGAGRSSFTASDPRKVFEYVISSRVEEIFGAGGPFGGMPGMRSGGGRSTMFTSMNDDDDDMGGFGSYSSFGGMPGGMGGMPGGMGGMSGMRGRPTGTSSFQPSEITRPLKISLNDLYTGTTKRLKVGRKLQDGHTEDKVLEIQVYPGWKSGTKIRFPKAGNEQPGAEAQDLVFVVEEKPHDVFKREGNDLVAIMKIPLVEALCGAPGNQRLTKVLELLDGRRLQVPAPLGIVKPGLETRIPGEGMPIRKEGSIKSKGDLIIKWEVEFPDRLTQSQKEALRKILS
ncbi:hypothetical protein M378DRAFT_112001 [Amanita muscaria Koide BX008]|uniref:J domain-containing protein n=1 Tax=Amanita muscaria (strain Koide BX008) TaxID=946122 RepID=A0A0C2WQL1_AMAMK|nr:hypothetical protein M378DRAFT_112001 [Amanita muscaria Koide BX008]